MSLLFLTVSFRSIVVHLAFTSDRYLLLPRGGSRIQGDVRHLSFELKGADTPPTQIDLLVAMHMVYLVLLIVELFRYADEQSTL